ncbi:LDCC motif putative metal-binding protein [Spirochaetia bacterium 38H-sp]|uniref:LDCC motif putative metal-binding protein n=1 Tax=Rarispira pelagica TaxID=3141764 RepID=A0ABU9UBS0_9SPIR
MAGIISKLKKWVDKLAEDNKKTFGNNATLDCCNLPGKKATEKRTETMPESNSYYSTADAELIQYEQEYNKTTENHKSKQ